MLKKVEKYLENTVQNSYLCIAFRFLRKAPKVWTMV